MVPWEPGFHSAFSWQQNTVLSKETYSCMVVLGVAGQRLWENPGRTVFLHFSPWHYPRASLPPVFCRRGLQRLKQAIYSSGLHLKVRSLNIDWERMWVHFSAPVPVSRSGMHYICILKRLAYWTTCSIWCVCISLCVCLCMHIFCSAASCPDKAVRPPEFDVLC